MGGSSARLWTSNALTPTHVTSYEMKFTRYFDEMRHRPDRAAIKLEWIQRVIDNPAKEVIQPDGRIRRWAPIEEMQGSYLRVILLADGETVHNAFFDRSFRP